MAHLIEELAIPASVDDPDTDPVAADFIATIDVRNEVEAFAFGIHDLAFPAVEILPRWLTVEFEPKRLFVVRVGGRIVARSIYETQAESADTVAWFTIQVLPEFRRRGIGAAMLEHLEAIAAAEGRTVLQGYGPSSAVDPAGPEGERMPSPTGFGSVPLAGPEVTFLRAHGYELQQVERASRLELPVPAEVLAHHLAAAQAAAGPDYALHSYIDRTPDHWKADLAALITRMSTDAPSAGLVAEEDPWTVERLDAEELAQSTSPREYIVSVVEHLPSGHLVAFTSISASADPERPADQEDTLVLREHRGHRLGMLLKVANLAVLQERHPRCPAIMTFNAEENRPMLDVNEAVGFRAVGYEGAWKKVVSAG